MAAIGVWEAVAMRFHLNPDKWDGKLKPGEAHLWLVDLEQQVSDVQTLWRVLSKDEMRRAESFCFPGDQHSFVIARGLLRFLLAAYTHKQPEALQFSYNANGKPCLSDGDALPAFNIAHSDTYALYAICANCHIGVDVERIRPFDGYLDIARGHFTPEEYSQITSAPDDKRSELFFRYWTLKEAVVKALGVGIDRLPDFRLRLFEDGAADVQFLTTSLASDM
ncbi:MAG: 4'-phosphopantetheinyl transferase superfamily protein, partial [Acidobacteriaceae bacterium]|nr:4'-phosphopantetheinyl transferase superfamily protein [Acidobacteriaceae bacterium]